MREVFMIRQKRTEFSVFILIGITIWLMAYSLFMTARTIDTVSTALNVFIRSILPSLAVFSVCAKILVKSDMTRMLAPEWMKGFLKSVGMSAGGFSAFVIGVLAGFPTGAAMLADLCEKGEMSEEEARSLLPFCNQASAAFLFGTVGESMFHDSRVGFIFFFAQTLTAWICVCLTASDRKACGDARIQRKPFGKPLVKVLTESVRESGFAMIGVCGFVVFFSLFGTVLFDTLSMLGFHGDDAFCVIARGALEISSGFLLLSKSALSMESAIVVGGILLGFSGLSVFMQAAERTEAFFFSPAKYFGGKLLAALICPIFSALFFFLYDFENGKYLIIAVSVLVFCIFCFFNYVKIKFFSKKCGKLERNAV